MFKLAKGITSLHCTFTGCWGNSAVLYSPHFVVDNVTVDDGLFSPLVDSLVDVSDIWTEPTTGVFDRFLFRHSSKDYKISNVEYLLSTTNNVIVSNTNTLNTSDVFNTAVKDNPDESFKANASLYGNLKDFFKNLTSLSNINRFANANYIDYDTINITTNVS
jgi:lipoprotein